MDNSIFCKRIEHIIIVIKLLARFSLDKLAKMIIIIHRFRQYLSKSR